MTEEKTFRKTKSVAAPADASTHSDIDFAMLEPRDQLKSLLQAEMADKPFSELSSVLFDHRGASIDHLHRRWLRSGTPVRMRRNPRIRSD